MSSVHTFSTSKLQRLLWLIVVSYSCFACQKDQLPPTARASVFPQTGDSTMVLEFNSALSTDNSTYLKGLSFSWDFDSDGNWDVENSQETLTPYQYPNSGCFKAILRVEDNAGLCDYDTITVLIKPSNHLVGVMTDERDQRSYKTVYLKGNWWMAENLSYGRPISSDAEQMDNGIVEKYFFKNDSVGYESLGGLYRWDEAINYLTNPQGICPNGWHLPTSNEWRTLLQDIDPWFAWQYFGKDGLSRFYINQGASARRENDVVEWQDQTIDHWSRDYFQLEFLREQAPFVFRYESAWGNIGVKYVNVLYDESDGIFLIASNYASVRCMKDN